MPKYWVKNYFAHGRFPEVGQKQKTEKKEEEEEERLNVGDNNGQATHGARKHARRTQATWAYFTTFVLYSHKTGRLLLIFSDLNCATRRCKTKRNINPTTSGTVGSCKILKGVALSEEQLNIFTSACKMKIDCTLI